MIQRRMFMQMYELIDRLNNGPCFLLAGQHYFINNGEDILLNAYNKKVNSNEVKNYNSLLQSKEYSSEEVTLTWLQNKANKVSVNDFFTEVGDIAWNGVFTSLIDTRIERGLKRTWREIQAVTNERYYPVAYKSINKLHITYLYGNIDYSEIEKRPPLDDFEFIEAKEKATKLISRITPEFMGPFGVLVIDGYNIEEDWLLIEQLYSVVNKLGKSQVYMFGVKDEFKKNRYINKLYQDKKINLFSESFQQYLINAKLEGIAIQENKDEKYSIANQRLMINNKTHVIPRQKYNNIIRNAEVLDDTLLLDVEELNEEEKSDMFREFLYKSSAQPVWSAYKYNFNIERLYEKQLEKEILKAINTGIEKESECKPIVIHGQTGTGKSVALGYSAYKIKMQKKYPVLFISKGQGRPNFSEIDEFCKWLEDCGAKKIIIYWDASEGADVLNEYSELSRYLLSRGRNVIIIGSSYKLGEKEIKKANCKLIEAPIELEKDEQDRLKNKFNLYSNSKEKIEQIWKGNYDNNFLVSLYRLMPATNLSIRRGVVQEIKAHKQKLIYLVKEKTEESILATLLKEIGFNFFVEEDEYEQVELDVKKIIQMVALVGQLGLYMPFELLLRMLDNRITYEAARVVNEVDFFRVIETFSGEIKIYPRSILEAKIIVNSNILTIDEQIDSIINIINHIEIKAANNDDDNEIEFLIKLLKAIGPSSIEQGAKYGEYYLDISQNLTDLREQKGIIDSRIILQEAYFLREYTVKNSGLTYADQISFLEKGEKILNQQIELLAGQKKNSKQLGYLFNEIASNIGSQLKVLVKLDRSKNVKNDSIVKQIRKRFNELEKYLDEAKKYAQDFYYPVDIWAWVIESIMESNLEEYEKLELKAKLLSIFEEVETEKPNVIQRQDYNYRLVTLKNIDTKNELTDKAFHRLLELKSSAGIYLKVKEMISSIDFMSILKDEQIKICKEVIQYLEQYQEIVSSDYKLSYTLFKLYWAVCVGYPLFYKEKQVLNISREGWNTIKQLLETLKYLKDGYLTQELNYIYAVTLFHLGEINESINALREIGDIYTAGPRRVIISYLAADLQGYAKLYKGTLQRITDDKAYIFISELRKTIPYFNKNFVQQNPPKDSTYEQIVIGFNFLGLQVASLNGKERGC